MKLIDNTDERLFKVSEECENPSSYTYKLMTDRMKKILRKYKGIGLSAPQVGINKRLFIMYIDNILTTCINPVIITKSDKHNYLKEGCLSFKYTELFLLRPERITVFYHTTKGVLITKRLEGLEARCFQHELDHLDGITFIKRKNEV